MSNILLRASIQAVADGFDAYRRERSNHMPENEALARLGVFLRHRFQGIAEVGDKLTTGAELAHEAFVKAVEKGFYRVFQRERKTVDLVARWRELRAELEAAMQPELFS